MTDRPPMILSVGIADVRMSQPEWAAQVTEAAEAAMIDLIMLGGRDATPFDPLVVAAWLAPRTRRIGLVPLVSTRRCQPFHVARALSALDFLSAGRSGWALAGDADEPDGRAADFIAATRSLWDSWEADALIIDPTSGRYLDSAKVRAGNHRGPFFNVRGPLNAARPLQGHPVMVADAGSALAADIAIGGTASRSAAPRMLVRATLGEEIAGAIEHYRSGVIDGVHIVLADAMTDIARLTDDWLPLLRPLLASADDIRPLRARLGLEIPA